MNRLYVCGSLRFIREMEELDCRLKEENIEYQISKRMNSREYGQTYYCGT